METDTSDRGRPLIVAARCDHAPGRDYTLDLCETCGHLVAIPSYDLAYVAKCLRDGLGHPEIRCAQCDE